MNQAFLVFWGSAFLRCVAVPLAVSPENSTAFLALAGSTGTLTSAVRAQLKARPTPLVR